MSKKMLAGLVALNLAFVPLTFSAVSSPAQASSTARDCCKESNEGEDFCCDQCCFFEDCDQSSDCEDTKPKFQ